MSSILSLPESMRAAAAAILREDPALASYFDVSDNKDGWFGFTPRPDTPEDFDEQASFCYNRDGMSFLIGGNAAGTTEAAAFKTALFLLHQQPPPRKDTPFWVISNSYDQVCGVAWDEKLHGHGHIPECEIEWDRIRWLSSKQNWPMSVPLKPWPKERGGDPKKNWMIEFKSYEQGRRALQARSIGGFWFSEQFPVALFTETFRGVREYMFPGGQFAEFTPVEPELCIWVEQMMETVPKGWRFYRCNTEKNKPNLAEGWYDQFFASVPDEMVLTRKTGALATFEGVIYQTFSPAVHVVGDDEIAYPFPRGVEHHRGIDWGASTEHPFACVFAYRDGAGDWCVYDEIWTNSQANTIQDLAVEVVARSLYWGWPPPLFFTKPELRGPRENAFCIEVAQRYGELAGTGNGRNGKSRVRYDQKHGESFADPSRPGDINNFNGFGVETFGAMNDIYKGIDTVRRLLKVSPATGKPKLFIHERCKHLAEEMRKYRWKRGRKPGESAANRNPAVALPVPLKRDEDCCDSLRYLLYTVESTRGLQPGSAKSTAVENRRSVQLERQAQNRIRVLFDTQHRG